jgi:hypothetical protein
MASEREGFNVKPPSVDLANRKDLFYQRFAERLKPALSVPDAGYSRCLDKQVTGAAQNPLNSRLRSLMQSARYVAGMARADDEIITIAEERRHLIEVRDTD